MHRVRVQHDPGDRAWPAATDARGKARRSHCFDADQFFGKRRWRKRVAADLCVVRRSTFDYIG